MKGVQGTFNLTDFKSAVGIGVTVSEEQIRSQIDQWVLKHREQIEAQRYQISNTAMREFRSHDGLRFADLKLVKKVLDERLTNLLGTRDAQDPPGKVLIAKAGSNLENGSETFCCQTKAGFSKRWEAWQYVYGGISCKGLQIRRASTNKKGTHGSTSSGHRWSHYYTVSARSKYFYTYINRFTA